jgi:hypothetical protein
VTTDLESGPEELVARYVSRWGIEQAFADARQVIGVGEARNRLPRAVEPTVPFGLTCVSLITVWYALHGHSPDDALIHRARARWDTTKTEPSYDDVTIKPRLVIITARLRNPCPRPATAEENPSRPRSLGRSRNMTLQNCESRVNLVSAQKLVHQLRPAVSSKVAACA